MREEFVLMNKKYKYYVLDHCKEVMIIIEEGRPYKCVNIIYCIPNLHGKRKNDFTAST